MEGSLPLTTFKVLTLNTHKGFTVFNRRFMTLTGLAAMPAKMILTGVCFYLVPLYIVSIGNTSAMAGRMLMVYAVMMVVIVPLAALAALPLGPALSAALYAVRARETDDEVSQTLADLLEDWRARVTAGA